jgi:hypothetical protein
MPQASSGRNLDEAKFNNLCAHYKDTYEIHLSSIKQRDTLFYALLVILALFSLQVTSTELVNSALSGFINKQLDISIDKNSNLLGTLLWLLLFGFSSRYYQTVIQIERQYDYIHHLEELISKRYPNTRAFTREGKSYLDEYPIFSNWIWLLYTLAFRVDTGNRIVAALNSAPFQVASIYAAEPRESSFTPSGRSSPLGDTCR